MKSDNKHENSSHGRMRTLTSVARQQFGVSFGYLGITEVALL